MMPVRSETYETVKDAYTLAIPGLAFRDIVSVKREGIGHDIITTGTVGNRQVLYTASGGLFTFDTAFSGYYELAQGPTVRGIFWKPEKIFVIWNE